MKKRNLKHQVQNLKKCTIVFFLMMLPVFLLAQSINITGTVIDDTGEPLSGANVVVKGTIIGVICDVDGRYSINVPNKESVLIFSFMGFNSQEIKVADKTKINVTLSEASIQIEEVVVVGYGVQKKESIVGSIVQTNSEDLKKSGNVTDLKQALTGRLPGVTTIIASGEPGGYEDGSSATQIFIRGQNSWNNSQPLILVDGVERRMENVDVNEVESISVLKDASATAVFGVKGANGVILITTKRGQNSRPQLSFNYNATAMTISKVPDKMDSYDALRIRNESIEREVSLNESVWADYTPAEVLRRYRERDYPEFEWLYPNVDWTKALFKDVGWSHKIGMNITGGTDFVKYFGSFSYLNEQDMFKEYDNHKGYKPGYDFNRFNFRSNFDINLTKTTLLKVNISGYYSTKNSNNAHANVTYGNNEMLWFAMYKMPPDLYIPQFPDGSWGQNIAAPIERVQNPVATAWDLGVRRTKNTQINTDLAIEQKLDFVTKGLKAGMSFFYDNNVRTIGGINDHANAARPDGNGYGRYIYPEKWHTPGQDLDSYSQLVPYSSTYGYQWVPTEWDVITDDTDYKSISRRMMYQAQINYNRKFGLHNTGALALFKREEYATGNMFRSYREDWVFRATYDYDSRYFFEGNGAYNGSEKFSPDYRFEFFPSVAVGWYLSNEKFFKLDPINRLKLRYSIGKVGEDSGGSRWLYQTQYLYGGRGGANSANLSELATGKSPYTFYSESVVANPDAHWETATKTNYGLELGMFSDMISLTYDYYTEKRKDIMISGGSRSTPPYFGATAPAANLGRVKSSGHEIELSFNRRNAYGLEYWITTAFTHTRNKVEFADDPLYTENYLKTAGYPIGQTRTQLVGDRYTSWDDVFASTQQLTNDQNKIPGFYNIIDFNGDGIIDYKDVVPYAYSNIPENTLNLSLGASFKGVSITLQFYGVSNVSRTVQLDNFPEGYTLNTVFGYARDFWSKNNPGGDSFLPRWKTANSEFIGDFHVYDASYIRLRTAEIAYNFQPSVLKRLNLSELRVFVNGNNLWYWSRLPDDRESGSPADRAYPVMKRINMGLNLTF